MAESTEHDLGTYCFNEAKVAHLRDTLPGQDRLTDVARALKAVAHPSRLAILRILDDEEGCVCDIAHTLQMPVSTASQHLKWLTTKSAEEPCAGTVEASAAIENAAPAR